MSDPATLTIDPMLASLLGRYGYAALAGGVLLESAGVPVPSETILITAALLATTGTMNPFVIAAVAAACGILGDNVGFAIGRRGGRGLLERAEGRFLPTGALVRLDAFFGRFGPFALVGGRFVSGVRTVVALGAGASGMPWRTFLAYNAAGAVVWAVSITAAAYLGGHAVIGAFARIAHPTTGVALLVTLAVLVWRWSRDRDERATGG
ncbi:MAG: DedA family protein [Coriobacteriia bacterium]|nr:DedA family protein [Coriobacteriia bacterium]